MNVTCKNREVILREQEPAAMQALARHAESCTECARQVQAWNSITLSARQMQKSWESPDLWPRIRQALAEQSHKMPEESRWNLAGLWENFGRHWQTAAALLVLLALTASGAWLLWRGDETVPTATQTPEAERRLLSDQAARKVEEAEAAYIRSIEDLAKLAEPKLERSTSPLMASYREKLVLIDSAIAELRSNIEQNRWNAHLRRELLSLYQDKQRTLETVLQER